MNSRPVNYSPLPTARFAALPIRNCDWFSVACPRREITTVCTGSLPTEYWWRIHSSLTLAVEGIRLNHTDVNSIVFTENRFRTLFRFRTGTGVHAKEEKAFKLCISCYFLSFIRFFRVKCVKYIIENLSVKSCKLNCCECRSLNPFIF